MNSAKRAAAVVGSGARIRPFVLGLMMLGITSLQAVALEPPGNESFPPDGEVYLLEGEDGGGGLLRIHPDGERVDLVTRYISYWTANGRLERKGDQIMIRVTRRRSLDTTRPERYKTRLKRSRADGWELRSTSEEAALLEKVEKVFEGSLREGQLEGVRLDGNKKRKLSGKRIDYGAFQWPLEKDGQIFAVRCRSSHPDIKDGQTYGAYRFEVVAPAISQGKVISFHPCGLGRATFVEGEIYLLRVGELRALEFGGKGKMCDTELFHMIKAERCGHHPRFPLEPAFRAEIQALFER